MGICTKCKGKTGFWEGDSCSADDCEVNYCNKCEKFLTECKECNNTYCAKHIKDHGCTGTEETEEESDPEEMDLDKFEKELDTMTDRQILRFIALKLAQGIQTLECSDNQTTERYTDLIEEIDAAKKGGK